MSWKEIEIYNGEVRNWARKTSAEQRNLVSALTKSFSGRARKEHKMRTRTFYGEVNRITYAFPLYMVYVHKGAGRGYGGTKTGSFSAIVEGRYTKRSTNEASKGKMGTGKRVAKPWFNPVIEKHMPELAHILAEQKQARAINDIQRILIR